MASTRRIDLPTLPAPVRGRRGAPERHAVGLEAELRRVVEGEVRFDAGSRGAYAHDASNYRQIPIGVVVPRSTDDVVATVRVCREHGAPILARGGGTSLAGQCCNVAVVLDFTKYMDRVLEIDPERRIARVQPGVVLDDLRAAALPHGLTFGPDPATHSHSTLGGMIGNNSCGIHSVMAEHYGPGPRTEDQVVELVVHTYDGLTLRVGATDEELLERISSAGGRRGEIYAGLRSLVERYGDRIRDGFPDIPRRVSGYSLPELLPENGFNVARALVGSESTCALTLEATVQLVEAPRHRSVLVLGYPSVYEAGDHIPEIMASRPIGLEGMDDQLVGFMERKGLHAEYLDLLPEGAGWLLVEFGGESRDEADAQARALMRELEGPGAPAMRLSADASEDERLWTLRESGLGATAFVPGQPPTWPGWEDAAVPPERVGDYLRDFRSLLDRYGYECALYGHFGQGCVHTRINFDLEHQGGVDRYVRFIEEAADLVVGYGGSLSGEHGDGQARGALLDRMYDADILEAFRAFRSIWDPDGRMNPGKGIDAQRPDENLVLGVGGGPREVATTFAFPEDGGSFAAATVRCVGVGKCRRRAIDAGDQTMCPSYIATKEEEHSTRGRARLLYEMLQGDVVEDGWRSEAVKDALDLCLACKGCKGDCPVHVDMATYKAEFLHHYYQGRLRPRHAFALGLIYWWARLASRVPRLANAVAGAPLLAEAAKRIAGIAPERDLPAFATETLRSWFGRRGPRPAHGPRVILWPDTFNNFFHAEVGRAGVEVLEAAGFHVVLPEAMLCCGRPLYDYGMLDVAKHMLTQVLDALRDDIRAGVPVVGLEPSCVATFRDELPGLFPDDPDARRLSRQTFLLSEFLEEHAGDFRPGTLAGRAVVHGHCHEKSVLDPGAGRALMERLGLECEALASGCCGMAGSFGFEEEHYEVSQACGEHALLPRLRDIDHGTLVVSDGFSCREMVTQNGLPRPLHTAEVVRRALEDAGRLGPADVEERPFGLLREGALVAGVLAGGWLALGLGRRLLRG